MAASFSTSHLATVKRWTKTFWKEALYGNVWNPFMGTDSRAVITVIPTLMEVSGDEATIHMTPKMPTSAVVRGDTQLQGNEVDLSIFTDKLTIEEIGGANIVRNKDISGQRVNLELKQQQYDLLRDFEMELLKEDILTALLDVTAGRTQARYRYGSSESNWNATHATALANIDNTADKASLKMIDDMAMKAKYKGQYKMNPARLSFDKGGDVEGFIAFLHPLAARDLRADPDYKNQVVYNDYIKANQAVFKGSFYLGEYRGVQMFEFPDQKDMMLATGAGAGSIDVAHNLLLGAEAAMIGWALKPEFRLELGDYQRVRGIGIFQIRGQKKVVFNSEDWATVHFFTAAVAS